MEPPQLPEEVPIALDPGVRIDSATRSLIGGTPLRIMRLSQRGIELVAAVRSGESIVWTPAVGRLWRRLTDAAMANPRPVPLDHEPDATFVVPVYDGREDLDPGLPAGTIVVHDAGPGAEVIRRVCRARGWRLVPLPSNVGPAEARAVGRREATSEFVVFVDAGVRVPDGLARSLGAAFVDPAVAAVAPRVRSAPGASLRERYEMRRSPLDLGSQPSLVRPDAPVSHVPTATLMVRAHVFDELDGFDPSLRFGEDVDFVWRLHNAGWRVRFEPAVSVEHAPRSSWRELWRQRIGYGSAAAPLDTRHPGAVAPVRLNVWSATAWAVAVLGRGRVRALGPLIALATTAALHRQLDETVTDPAATALHLAGRGTLQSGRWLGQAVTRAWLPIAVVISVIGRRPGPLVLAVAGPAAAEWLERRPKIDPSRWIVLRALDDAAYCAGVWKGMASERSWGAIRPRFTGIRGLGANDREGASGSVRS